MTSEGEYGRSCMADGDVVHQSKARAPIGFHFVALAPVLLSAFVLMNLSTASHAPAWLPFLMLPSLLVTIPIWLLFSVLRATVTSKHVHMQYGLFGPKIPLEKIDSCESTEHEGPAVKLRWRDENERPTVTFLSAPDPDAFVRAVSRAKATNDARVSSSASRV